MTDLEDIIYDAGRSALAEQSALVAGIRQGTASLLAAQALVASFLGGPAIRSGGFTGWVRPAVIVFVLGLVIATLLLAPWRMRFALDARELYERLEGGEAGRTAAAQRALLTSAAFAHRDLARKNGYREAIMRGLLTTLCFATVAQTLFWLRALV